MSFPLSLSEIIDCIVLAGPFAQVATATIAMLVAIQTFRHQKRQNTLSLINQNDGLANQVNTTLIQSAEGRATLGSMHDFIVGCPDDAILFMYLNYVHNTFRTWQIGVVSRQVWLDTLGSCVTLVGRLRRDQLERLLSRGYERAFQQSVLNGYDRAPPPADRTGVATLRPARSAKAAASAA